VVKVRYVWRHRRTGNRMRSALLASTAFTIIGCASAHAQTFTTPVGSTQTVPGVIADGGTPDAVVVNGGGTLILSGNNTYSGGTTICGVTGVNPSCGTFAGASTLELGVDSVFHTPGQPASGIVSSAIGTGTLTFDGGKLQALGLFSERNVANAIQITANGGTIDSGGGFFRITGNMTDAPGSSGGKLVLESIAASGEREIALSGVNTYSGITYIGSGTVIANSTTALSPNSAFQVNTGATLTLSGFSNTIASLADGSAGGGIVQNGAASGTATLTINGANGVNTSFSGVLQDGGGGGGGLTLSEGLNAPVPVIVQLAIVKDGSGTLILSGTNTYTGGTTISGGFLQLGNGGSATGSIVGNVLDNANFAIYHSDAFVFGGVISGSGAFQQIGTGTTTLTAANTYTGLTTVSFGTLTISGTGSITSNVTNNATFNNAGTVTGSVNNNVIATNTGTITNGVTNNFWFYANGGAVNGAIVNNTGGIFNVGGTVTSNGTFTNAGGALSVGTTGAYTLQGLLTNSGLIVVANGGQLTDTVGGITNTSTGTISVLAGGTVKDDLNNAGAVTNSGAYLANVATNTGIITNNSVWTGNVASNAGTIVNNLTWTGTVSNAGMFTNSAGASVSGLLTNTAGVVTNDGTLAGGAVINGGVLTGTGSVANLTVGNGGALQPGNGTPGSSMTVAGNLAFQSGGLYLVQFNPATSTFASVTGTATLNGLVGASFASGSYVAKQYTILTATGGVGGTFSGLDSLGLPAGFKESLSYDAHDAYLDLALNFTPSSPNFGGGLNINQQNVANSLVNFFNSTGGIPMVFGTLTPAGLTQVSGETATGSQQATFDAMDLFLGLLTDPFINRSGNGANGAGATPFADEASAYASNGRPRTNGERDAYAAMYGKAPPAAPFVPSWSVWAAGYGGSQTTDGNAALGSNTASSSIAGTAVGADYRFSPYTLAGFALAGGGTNFSVNGFGSGRSDLFQAGAYVRHMQGPAYISAALAYGWQDITTNRTVTVAGIDQLQARFNANAYSGRAEGGYRFATPWMGVTPYAAAQFTTFDLPAYAEQAIVGSNMFALAYGARDVTDTRSELGIRTDKSFAMQNGILTLRGRFAWAHDFDPDRGIGATFQSLPGASFVVNGAAQAHDSALTTASAEMKWMNGWSAAATFEGEFSQVTRSYAGKGVVRYAW